MQSNDLLWQESALRHCINYLLLHNKLPQNVVAQDTGVVSRFLCVGTRSWVLCFGALHRLQSGWLASAVGPARLAGEDALLWPFVGLADSVPHGLAD